MAMPKTIDEEIKRRGIEADVVLPIPETSRIAAGAMAEALDQDLLHSWL